MDGRIGTGGPAVVTADRPMTEMEQHGGQLADTAQRLNIAANKLESRIEQFVSAPPALKPGNPEQTGPAPSALGTLGSLRHYHGEIERHTNRIERAVETLTGII